MKRYISILITYIFVLLSATGCCQIGSKSMGLSKIYGVTAILSLLLLIGYCCLIKAKDVWFLLLFTSVLVVNIGYLSLAISFTIEEALLANRISYLGSVFLPMSMLMIILNVININYKKWLPGILLGIGIIIFLIAASPGYLTIYYKEVFLERINGVTVLNKVYGPLHSIYLFYLLLYFGSMVALITYAIIKKKIENATHSIILVLVVFLNIGVWLVEQLVKIDFEILSFSYIFSELFLLGLHMIIAENEKLKDLVAQKNNSVVIEPTETHSSDNQKASGVSSVTQEQVDFFVYGLETLTKTERIVFKSYIERKTTKEIMSELDIKENTLKFHNKNLYSKLGVSSRKQLIEIYKHIEKQ